MDANEEGRGSDTGLRWIGAAELMSLVSMDQAIGAVNGAMRALSKGRLIAPRRWSMPLDETARMGLMPGALPDSGRFGVKVLSMFGSAARGPLPSHQGVMLLFDMADGRSLCAIDAAALTALRTAAATAVATRALARPESSSLAIIGCGDQAALHVQVLRTVLPLRRIFLWNRTRAKAERFAETLSGGVDILVCVSPETAVRDADVVCTLTSSPKPLLYGRDFHAGQHVNLIGSSTAGPREVDDVLVARSRYFVDCRDHALDQAAELKSAIDNGLVNTAHIVGEIGEVLLGHAEGRMSPDDLTVYKSLGHVVQDLAVADMAYGIADGCLRSGSRSTALPITD